jgi:hypothetical protein
MPHSVSLVLAGIAVVILFVVKKALELLLTNEYVGWARMLARFLVNLAGIICPSRAREWRAGLRYFQERDKTDPGLRMAASHLAWSPWHTLRRLWNRHDEAPRPIRSRSEHRPEWPVRYLLPGERLIHFSRRHTVVLGTSFAVFLISLALGLSIGAESYRLPTYHLGQIGAGITLLGTLYFGWRAGQWSRTRYVITNERILLIEGLVARRITALPLRLVIETSYRRTIGGRLLGYCDLELSLSGHPGLRSLTRVPSPDQFYMLILRLLSE